MVHFLYPSVYAGTALCEDGDPEAVRELGLLSFEMVMNTPATELNVVVTGTGRVVAARKGR